MKKGASRRRNALLVGGGAGVLAGGASAPITAAPQGLVAAVAGFAIGQALGDLAAAKAERPARARAER